LHHVRILLAGMSNMLSSIVSAALAQAPDMVVAGHVSEGKDLVSEIHRTGAEAVIVQVGQPGADESFAPLLHSFPALKVVAIDGTCSSGFVHQLRPYSFRLAELSADMLQSVLRADSCRESH
jgi:hypothetical protein